MTLQDYGMDRETGTVTANRLRSQQVCHHNAESLANQVCIVVRAIGFTFTIFIYANTGAI
jgi:hypothetical protein